MAKAMLICKLPPASVEFDFNPEQITMTRQTNSTQRGSASTQGASSGSTGSILRGSPQSKLTMTVQLYGTDTKSRCDTLLDWMNPGGGLLSRAIGAVMSALGAPNLTSGLPRLMFIWGPPGAAFTYECTLAGADVTYKRFDPSGAPLRADVKLTLQEQPSLLSLLPTNPTSGGLPGRHVHIVSEGENLQTISTAAYGHPAHWRSIADVNGIDDPTRVHPGRRLFLPNPGELYEGARS
ncbi:MAG TPA: hypothetical protein VN636_16075 [Acidimicrobiia bacterium]|nr:hypothetical protein [Acidimicrobiia bacterium]